MMTVSSAQLRVMDQVIFVRIITQIKEKRMRRI